MFYDQEDQFRGWPGDAAVAGVGANQGRFRGLQRDGAFHRGDEPPQQDLRRNPPRGDGAGFRAAGASRQLQSPLPPGRRHAAVRHDPHEPASGEAELRFHHHRAVGQQGLRRRGQVRQGQRPVRRQGKRLHRAPRSQVAESEPGRRVPAHHVQRDHRRHPVARLARHGRRPHRGGHVQRHHEPEDSGGEVWADLRGRAEEPWPCGRNAGDRP